MVLSTWSLLFPPRRAPIQMSNQIQIVENKSVENSIAEFVPASKPVLEKSTPLNVQQKTTRLENDKLIAEFSNQGGELVKVTVKQFQTELPVTSFLRIVDYQDNFFEISSVSEDSIEYVYDTKEGRVYKKYTLSPDEYTITAEIELPESRSINIDLFAVDIARLDNANPRDNSLFEYFLLSSDAHHRKDNAFKFSPKEARSYAGTIDLAGFRDRYFCAIIKPDFVVNSTQIDVISEHVLEVKAQPQAASRYRATLYFGPQEMGALKKYKMGFEQAMVFSNWGWLDVLAKGIFSLMQWIHKIIPNWGVCIILISLIIYGAMYPLTLSGMSSMRRMQEIQPKLTQLREQHKNNPQRLNKEIMELYKEHRVNPLGGCLPLFLQMPFFYALYYVMWRSVAFKGAGFLWIKDLSAPDRLFIFPYKLPLLEVNELNILPLVMAGLMFLQQKASAKNMVIADPQQAASQKMMMTILPVMMGVLFYKMASGWLIYFIMSSTMSTLTQLKMSKMKSS